MGTEVTRARNFTHKNTTTLHTHFYSVQLEQNSHIKPTKPLIQIALTIHITQVLFCCGTDVIAAQQSAQISPALKKKVCTSSVKQ
jgi:hypothetical protein